MHLDHVAVGIIEENLVPAFHRPVAPIGIWDALRVQMCLESLQIIGAVGDVAVADRVDLLPGSEPCQRVLLRKMRLDCPIAVGSNTCSLDRVSIPDTERRHFQAWRML